MHNLFGSLITSISNQRSFDLNLLGYHIPFEVAAATLTLLTLFYLIRSLRVAMKSNEISTVPILIIRYASDARNPRLQLVNMSDKFAYNVTICPLLLQEKSSGIVYKVIFDIDGKNYIQGNSEIDLVEKKLKGGAIHNELDFATIVSSHQKQDTLLVYFKDSQSIKYFTRISFDKGNENVVKSPTRLTIYWRLNLWLTRNKRKIKFIKDSFTLFDREYPEIK